MRLPLLGKHAPVVLAAVLLLLCYAGRNFLFGKLITNIVASQIEAAAGPAMDVRIEQLRGSWFTGISLEGISTAKAAESGPLRAVSAERIELRYSAFGFFDSKPLNAVRSVTARNLRVHLAPGAGQGPGGEQSQAEPMLLGRLIASLLDNLPARLAIDADVEVVIDAAAHGLVAFQAALSGNLKDDLHLSVEFAGGTDVHPLVRDKQIGLTLRATDRSLRLRSLAEENSLPIDLEGRIEVSGTDPAHITVLALSFEAGPLKGSLSATQERAAVILALSLDRVSGIPFTFLSETSVRYGTLAMRAEAEFGPEAPRSVLDLLLFRPQEVLPFMNASINANFDDWSVADLAVVQGEVRISWDGNHLTLHRLDLDAGRTGGMKIEGMVLDPAAAFPITSLARADVRVQDLGKVIGTFTAEEEDIAAAVDQVVISASSDGQGILTISSLDIRGTAAAYFRAAGIVDVTVPSIRHSEFSFRIPDLEILKLSEEPGVEPATLSGSVSGEGSFSGSLAADGPFAILNGASGRLALKGDDLLVSGFSLRSFQLSAILSQGTIMAEQARLVIVEEEEEYLVALQNPATVTFSDRAVSLELVDATVLGGELSLKGTVSDRQVFGSVSLDGVQIEKILQLAGVNIPVSGSITAKMTAEGPLVFPRLAITIRSADFSIRDTVGNLYLELRQDDRTLLLDQLKADFGSLLQLTGYGRLPFRIGSAGFRYLHLREPLFVINGTTESLQPWLPEKSYPFFPDGKIVFNAFVVEESGEFGVSMLLRNRDNQILAVDIRMVEDEGNHIRAGLTIRVDGQQIADISGRLTVPGLSRSEPQIDPKRIAISGLISLNLSMESLITFVPQVIYMSGMIRGNIKAEGTLAQPVATGSIEISDAELRTKADIPSISAVNGVVRLDGRKITVDDLRGELGYALFLVTAAARLPSRGDAGSVDARLSGSNLLLVTNSDLRARADVDISVRGTFEDLRISGMVEVSDARFTQDISLFSMNMTPSVGSETFHLFSVRGKMGENTDLDIRVRADQTIRIRNNLFSGNLSMDLHIGGTLQVPIPTGRIFGDQGELNMPLTTVRLRQILVRFPQENPFSPVVLISGVAQIRGYELDLNVSGSLPDVEVQITSNPPLRQEQALILLTTRYTPQELVESDSQTVRTLGGYLGIQLFSSLLGGGEGDGEPLLDRVDIVIGKGISIAGQETVEIELRLGAGDSWYMVFERDRYDRYNLDLAWRFRFE